MNGLNSSSLNPLDYQVCGQCWSLNKRYVVVVVPYTWQPRRTVMTSFVICISRTTLGTAQQGAVGCVQTVYFLSDLLSERCFILLS